MELLKPGFPYNRRRPASAWIISAALFVEKSRRWKNAIQQKKGLFARFVLLKRCNCQLLV